MQSQQIIPIENLVVKKVPYFSMILVHKKISHGKTGVL